MRKITVKDIAFHLGVSPATVSHALANRPKVALKTRLRVQEAAAAMSYVPNRVAQSMRLSQSDTIGIVVPSVRDSFFSEIVDGIEQEAKEVGTQCFLCQTHNSSEKLIAEVDALLSHMVKGVIIHPHSVDDDTGLFASLSRRGPNLVLLGQQVRGISAPLVKNDERRIGKLATEHLLQKGHKQIAWINGNQKHTAMQGRYQGYQDALTEAGIITCKELEASGGFEEESGYQAVEVLLARGIKFTAVVAPNDFAALGAVRRFTRAGYRIPQDVAVIGCGNLDFGSLMTPTLSTIDQFPFELGRAAFHLLTEDKLTNPPRTISIDSKVVERESTSKNV